MNIIRKAKEDEDDCGGGIPGGAICDASVVSQTIKVTDTPSTVVETPGSGNTSI